MIRETPDAVVELIRKLLTKTTANGCTEAEAATAFAMASRKLAEHNLTLDEVRADEQGEESWLETEVHETGRWSLEDNICYGILREFYFVEGFFNRNGNRKVFLLFGKPENVAVGRFVWSALHASFDRCWMMYSILNKVAASDKRLFIAGMGKGYSQKLRDEREAQVIERDIVRGSGTGTALALASINDKIHAAYKESHPQHSASKGTLKSPVGNVSALAAGIEAGRTLNLNRALNAPRRKAIQ